MAGLPYGLISRRLTALFHHCQPLSAIVRETGWPGVSDLAGDGFGEIDHGFLGWHGWDSSSKPFAFIRVICEIRGPMVWCFCDGPPSLFHAIVASGFWSDSRSKNPP